MVEDTRRRLRRGAILLARCLAVALVCLAAIELLLRMILGLGNPVRVEPDAAAGYVLEPNQDVTRFFCHTRIDRNGLRSDAFNGSPAPGVLRVLFVGDSVTYGTTRVDQRQIFTSLLRRQLPAVTSRPVEVLNASANGWAIDNELGFVRSRGLFGAQLVVLVLNSGDPGQPRARLEDLGEDLGQGGRASALGELWSHFVAPRLRLRNLRGDAGTEALNSPAQIASNLSDLDAFDELVQSGGARLALVYIPFRKELPEPAGRFDHLLSDWAGQHGVPYFDLTAVEAAHSVDEFTLDHGTHLSKAGNQQVADAIASEWKTKIGTK